MASNIFLGIFLAIGILWWFPASPAGHAHYRHRHSISLLATFIVLNTAGAASRHLLAGLAFAVGMVLDAAIVVLENIVRLRERA